MLGCVRAIIARPAAISAAAATALWSSRFSSSSSAAASPSPHASSSEPPLPLQLVAESILFASPEKAAAGKRGEDACFISRYAFGVADGVGGWAAEGIDSGEYSRRLMKKAHDRCVFGAGRDGQFVDPTEAIMHAHRLTRLRGSSTAAVVTAGCDGAVHVSNVGDSGVMWWRHHLPRNMLAERKLPLTEAARLWSLEAATVPQTYFFNAPNQLEYGAQCAKPQELTWRAAPGDICA